MPEIAKTRETVHNWGCCPAEAAGGAVAREWLERKLLYSDPPTPAFCCASLNACRAELVAQPPAVGYE